MSTAHPLAFCWVVLGLAVLPSLDAANAGRRFPAEMRALVDRGTGLPLVALTTAPSNDAKIYQTHPQWAADGVHVVFRSSDRTEDKTPQAFAVNEITGAIIQLTDGANNQTGSLNVARKSNKLYFARGARSEPAQLIELDLDALFADSAADALKEAAAYERIIMRMPDGHRDSGGFTLDADERVAYFGVSLADPPRREPGQPVPQVPGGIRAVDLQTGAYTKVIDVEFRMGHVQANPWVAGEIMYCHETGGDAPQRMWLVNADGTGNRPLFVEGPDDWVTHETFVDRDHITFNLMAHTPKLRHRPGGIMLLNLRNDEILPLGQTSRGRGFWHCNGTPDERWAVGDNFAGEIHLIDRQTGTITLLSTGHEMRPDHAHPNFSPDGRRILVQSGLLSGGQSLDLIVIPIPERLLQ